MIKKSIDNLLTEYFEKPIMATIAKGENRVSLDAYEMPGNNVLIVMIEELKKLGYSVRRSQGYQYDDIIIEW